MFRVGATWRNDGQNISRPLVNLDTDPPGQPAGTDEDQAVGGQIFVGNVGMALSLAGAAREPMTDYGLFFVRRVV